MFSATVMCGYSAYDWKTIAMSRSFGSTVGDVVVADEDRAVVGRFQAGEHAQRGRLPAPRRSHQHQELAVGDGQIEVGDGGQLLPRIDPRRTIEGHGGHGPHRTPPPNAMSEPPTPRSVRSSSSDRPALR